MPKTIATVDEYEAATQRISELENFPEGTPQAAELAELVAAVMEWDRTHDDATAWKG
jgi:hypothetical protein